jgi:hypothetical protein
MVGSDTLGHLFEAGEYACYRARQLRSIGRVALEDLVVHDDTVGALGHVPRDAASAILAISSVMASTSSFASPLLRRSQLAIA